MDVLQIHAHFATKREREECKPVRMREVEAQVPGSTARHEGRFAMGVKAETQIASRNPEVPSQQSSQDTPPSSVMSTP
jgi:hypothetical protein